MEGAMALKIPRCARCSGACELKTLPSVSGENGPLKLTALEMPVFAQANTGISSAVSLSGPFSPETDGSVFSSQAPEHLAQRGIFNAMTTSCFQACGYKPFGHLRGARILLPPVCYTA